MTTGNIIACIALIVSTVLWIIAYKRERNYSKGLQKDIRNLKKEKEYIKWDIESFTSRYRKLIEEKEKNAQKLSSYEKTVELLPNDYKQFIKAEVERMQADD